MVRFGWPRPPLVLGFVLGRLAETYLFISVARYGFAWLGAADRRRAGGADGAHPRLPLPPGAAADRRELGGQCGVAGGRSSAWSCWGWGCSPWRQRPAGPSRRPSFPSSSAFRWPSWRECSSCSTSGAGRAGDGARPGPPVRRRRAGGGRPPAGAERSSRGSPGSSSWSALVGFPVAVPIFMLSYLGFQSGAGWRTTLGLAGAGVDVLLWPVPVAPQAAVRSQAGSRPGLAGEGGRSLTVKGPTKANEGEKDDPFVARRCHRVRRPRARSGTCPPHAQAPFYKGKTVSVVVGAKGGSLTVAAQLVGQHLGRHVPGNPSGSPSRCPVARISWRRGMYSMCRSPMA